MSVTDVQRAFLRGLDGHGSCKAATIEFEDGGRTQRLGFHVVSSIGAAYLSEAIPADMCPMQHARHMATNFIEGRIAGQSRIVSVPVQQLALPAPAVAVQAAPAFVQAVALAPVKAAPLAPVQAPATHEPDPDELDPFIDAGDIPGLIDKLCEFADAEADELRTHWVTSNPGQFLEYEQVRREISDLAYKLVQPTPAACPCLWASVGSDVPKTGNDANDIRAAAALINQCIDATNDMLARIRAARLQAKTAIRAATSIEDALATYQAVAWPSA